MSEPDFTQVKVVATDIDGTLTNKNYLIHLEAIRYIRLLEKNGIKVILISGHTFPTVSTLSQYIGTTAPVVAENGCVIGYKWEPILLGKPIENKQKLIDLMIKLGFKPTKSTQFKFIDLAFRRTEKTKDLTTETLQQILSNNGFLDLEISDSGFAVHLAPQGLNKGTGLLRALDIMNLHPENCLFIGDGGNDLPAFEVAGISVAVKNAPDDIKRRVDIVTSKPYGEGFVEIAKTILLKLKKLD